MLDELLSRLAGLDPKAREELVQAAVAKTANRRFIPNAGPQLAAWDSEADETFFGGAAGGGKSALLVGLAIEKHKRSIIFRREYPQIRGLVDEAARILGTRDGYNSQDKVWRIPGPDDRVLEFGSVPHEDDKERYQGRAHDLKGFDEITGFSESQYRFLIGWTRTTDPTQRTRIVATGNPPLTAEGMWVIRYWGPWLDPTHPNPAKPGELRWFTTVNGEDREVDGRGPHVIDGKEIYARSRTFILSRLEDNPDLMRTGYVSTLEAMPEPMRTMLREGRFDVAAKDAEFQVIPTRWVLEAEARWTKQPPTGMAMTAMGFDPAGGGSDVAALAYRYGGWYGEIITKGGEDTADGSRMAAMVMVHRRDTCPVVVDMGGGYGGSVTQRLKDNGVAYVGHVGSNKSVGQTVGGTKLGFANKRAESYWRFREALDPDQQGGSALALPPDPELRAELTAPTWELTPRGILVESKEDIRKRLGRSTNKADAVVMALSEGSAAQRKLLRIDQLPTRANVGFDKVKRIYGRR